MKKKKHTFKTRNFISAILILLAVCAAAFIFLTVRQSSRSVLAFSEATDAAPAPLSKNVQPTLSVPTQLTKIGEDYFLVDCYHDQILTSADLHAPLSDWYVLTSQIDRGHTIAGDGVVYLADDTENNRILIFEKRDGLFVMSQIFSDIGIRPHYVSYDEDSKRFYALSSMTGQLYVFFRPDPSSPQVALEKILSIPELDGVYVRSFTIDGDDIYFVSGNSAIIRARKKDLKVLERFPVPPEIAGMIQLTRIQDWFYITVSTDAAGDQSYATILRVKNLSDLSSKNYEDIYSSFIGGGTPYYITGFDGHFYMTEHRIPGHSVWQFDVKDNEPVDIITLFP